MNFLINMKESAELQTDVAVITLATIAAQVGSCGASVLLVWPSESGFSSWFWRIDAFSPM